MKNYSRLWVVFLFLLSSCSQEDGPASDGSAKLNKLLILAKSGDSNACTELLSKPNLSSILETHFKGEEVATTIFLLENSAPSPVAKSRFGSQILGDATAKESDRRFARTLLKDASESYETSAWSDYINVCMDGVGGEISNNQAYFWLFFQSLMVDPDSPFGETVWEKRLQLETLIQESVSDEIRRKVIERIESHGYPPFYFYIREDKIKEIRERIISKNREHNPSIDLPLFSHGTTSGFDVFE